MKKRKNYLSLLMSCAIGLAITSYSANGCYEWITCPDSAVELICEGGTENSECSKGTDWVECDGIRLDCEKDNNPIIT